MPSLGAQPYVSPSALSAQPATTVRYRILALLMAYAGMCHFNRISITVAGAERIIDTSYGISAVQMGMVYSSYLFVYTLCMLPGGWLIDRFGPKAALMLLGFGSVILVPLTGLTSIYTGTVMLVALCVIRGLLGVVSAPMHPGAARSVSFWIPYSERSVANGLVTGAALVGISTTYYLFGSLMDLVSWPWAFAIAGAATLVLAAIWTAYATDRPEQHRAVNEQEREWIAAGDPAHRHAGKISAGSVAASVGQGGSLLALFANRGLVLLTFSYAAYSYFQYLFFYWMQFYFKDQLKVSDDDSRLYSTIPTLAMAVGMVLGGRLADRCEARLGVRVGRAVAPVLGMAAGAVCLLAGISGNSVVWIVTWFALALGALGLAESTFWVTGVQLGRQRGGLSGAFLNTGGNAGGIISPIVTPLLSSVFGWTFSLAVASALCLVGAATWWWITPHIDADPLPNS